MCTSVKSARAAYKERLEKEREEKEEQMREAKKRKEITEEVQRERETYGKEGIIGKE